MLTNKEIEVLCYCRGCLNRKCGLDLERSDIQYYYDVLNICKCCQQEKHVVFSIQTAFPLEAPERAQPPLQQKINSMELESGGR